METIGRDAELAAAAAFLDAIPEGPSALLLEGEAGIGKTTVWRAAVQLALAGSFRVLACSGSQSEAKLSFAGLGDLAGDAIDEVIGELPTPQRRALEVALLRAEAGGRAPDRRTVAVGFLGALRALAASTPILIAVDDLQWLDGPSAGILEFAVRRLGTEPVGVLATMRPHPDRVTWVRMDQAMAAGRVRRLTVGPLSLGAIQHLVRAEVGKRFSRPTMQRVFEASGGNPFFALELARALDRQGAEPGPTEPLSVPEDLRELVRGRLAALPARVSDQLLVLSAVSRPTVGLIADTGTSASRAADDLHRAVAAGVVEVTSDRVRFTHPLLASVRYSEASPWERRRVHLRLARVLTDPEEHARHLALSAKGPAEPIAAALEQAARTAEGRGAPDAAAELMALACGFTPKDLPEALRRRRIQLGEYQLTIGDVGQARAHLEELVVSMPPGPDRAGVLLILAYVLEQSEGPPAGIRVAQQALDEAGDDRLLLARTHVLLCRLHPGDPERLAHHARAVLELLADDTSEPGLRSQAMAQLARADSFAGRGIDLDLMERAAELEAQTDWDVYGIGVRWAFAINLKYAGDFERARPLHNAEYRDVFDRGDETEQPIILTHLAQLECWAGHLALAARYAQEGVDIGRRLEGPGYLPFVLCIQALVNALLGNLDEARAQANEGRSVAERAGMPLMAAHNLYVLGFIALSLGDWDEADERYALAERMTEAEGVKGNALWQPRADHVEAVISIGDLDRAEKLLRAWEEYGATVNPAWAGATSARCRALLAAVRGDLDGALAWADRALMQHERVPMPFELGRTLLVRGQIERRTKRRRASRESLSRAVQIFEGLPAPLWAAKAKAELSRIGGRASSAFDLTPTEERVAELVAAGRTNREVAEGLFMALHTVEANLTRIYRKLGVSSRAELRRLLRAERLPAPPA